MALRIPLLVLVLLASGCNQQADLRVPTKPVVRDSTEGSQQIAPRTDYHQHLASPAAGGAGGWDSTWRGLSCRGRRGSGIAIARGELVKDKSALAKLFTHDAVVLKFMEPRSTMDAWSNRRYRIPNCCFRRRPSSGSAGLSS